VLLRIFLGLAVAGLLAQVAPEHYCGATCVCGWSTVIRAPDAGLVDGGLVEQLPTSCNCSLLYPCAVPADAGTVILLP
jgi:hypothetical protein